MAWGRHDLHPNGSNKSPHFHTLVCRPQTASVIGTRIVYPLTCTNRNLDLARNLRRGIPCGCLGWGDAEPPAGPPAPSAQSDLPGVTSVPRRVEDYARRGDSRIALGRGMRSNDPWYESMSRTPIRDQLPRPISSFRRRPESRGAEKEICSAVEHYARGVEDSAGSEMRPGVRGACPALGWGRGRTESAAQILFSKSQLWFFIYSCASASRDERLVRKWCYAALSVPAFHGSRTSQFGPPFVMPAKAGIQRGGDGRGKLALNRFYGPTPFSSFGVPAPAGMSDWCKNMCRTLIRGGLRSANLSIPAKSLPRTPKRGRNPDRWCGRHE